ncbi:SnoaL-like domain-containing protein [Pseudofulvibacter geojedonensis]|uniref:SnoaL-like domain-containing protein n=1 Tax=Pseudofulvibacter geojedonensis TaxID=1123758 RepID=A0ABW3I3F0_9FLAO
MTTQEIANRLVELCRQEKHPQAQEELYHSDIISIEDVKSGAPITEGMENIRKKTIAWEKNVADIHSAYVSDPIVTGNYFVVSMENDITFKDIGRTQIKELCVYEVKEGKIVKEQFFYDM